ncbi:MAG: hypothetical protein LQ346_008301, partial [Caloplaca aetnensis]
TVFKVSIFSLLAISILNLSIFKSCFNKHPTSTNMYSAPLLLAIFSTLSLTSAKTLTSTFTGTTTVVSNSPEQTSSQLADLQAYASTLTTDPKYQSYHSILATAVPSADLANVEIDPTKFTTTVVPYTVLSGYSALPTDAKSYFSSINQAQESIVTKALAGAAPKPTGAIAVAGAAAAGVLGLAAVL